MYEPYNRHSSGIGGGHIRVRYRREPNFLERIGSSFVGSIIGVFVVVGACVLLFWNEVLYNNLRGDSRRLLQG